MQSDQHHIKVAMSKLIKYSIICANEAIDFFFAYFVPITKQQSQQYHYKPISRNNNNNNNNNNSDRNTTEMDSTQNTLINLYWQRYIKQIQKHFQYISIDIVANHVCQRSITSDEIQQFLFKKFLKNCEECSQIDVFEQIKRRSLNIFVNINDEFYAILKRLCSKSSIMPPVSVPKFTQIQNNTQNYIAKQNHHTTQNHITKQLLQIGQSKTNDSNTNNANNRRFQSVPDFKLNCQKLINQRLQNERISQRKTLLHLRKLQNSMRNQCNQILSTNTVNTNNKFNNNNHNHTNNTQQVAHNYRHLPPPPPQSLIAASTNGPTQLSNLASVLVNLPLPNVTATNALNNYTLTQQKVMQTPQRPLNNNKSLGTTNHNNNINHYQQQQTPSTSTTPTHTNNVNAISTHTTHTTHSQQSNINHQHHMNASIMNQIAQLSHLQQSLNHTLANAVPMLPPLPALRTHFTTASAQPRYIKFPLPHATNATTTIQIPNIGRTNTTTTAYPIPMAINPNVPPFHYPTNTIQRLPQQHFTSHRNAINHIFGPNNAMHHVGNNNNNGNTLHEYLPYVSTSNNQYYHEDVLESYIRKQESNLTINSGDDGTKQQSDRSDDCGDNDVLNVDDDDYDDGDDRDDVVLYVHSDKNDNNGGRSGKHKHRKKSKKHKKKKKKSKSKLKENGMNSNSNSNLAYGEAMLTSLDMDRNANCKKIIKRFLCFTKNAQLDLDVVRVYQIRNDKLLGDYNHRKASILRGLDGEMRDLNERYLYHGTSLEVIPKIMTQGFLRQFTIRHAFGQGCYFAVSSAYSTHPRYAARDRDGLQYVFVCCVVCGESCAGHQSMKVPDCKPNRNNILYETTVDKLDLPSVYVTFNDNQAIAQYLICFRNRSC